jgi:hypothetical protein
MIYQTGAISTAATSGGSGTWSGPVSGGVAGDLNLPKDLSLLNRRGYASTTRKGVPLVYQCKIDFYLHNEDGAIVDSSGNAITTAFGSDAQAVLKVDGCQNNWVMRNAAVKFHAAREKMFADAGIKRADRGSYSHEIRYNYDANGDSWLVPVDGDGDAFTGGTWDVSSLAYESDVDFELKLVGAGDNEEANAFAGTALQIGHSYLLSRVNQQSDTNLQTEEGPAKYSLLKSMLSDETITENTDDVTGEARDAQDNPPYEVLDLSDSGDINHDITEPVELGRAVAGLGNAYGSVIVDIPFGLANLKVKIDQAAAFSMEPTGLICVEVLDIYEMQG